MMGLGALDEVKVVHAPQNLFNHSDLTLNTFVQ